MTAKSPLPVTPHTSLHYEKNKYRDEVQERFISNVCATQIHIKNCIHTTHYKTIKL